MSIKLYILKMFFLQYKKDILLFSELLLELLTWL